MCGKELHTVDGSINCHSTMEVYIGSLQIEDRILKHNLTSQLHHSWLSVGVEIT